MAFPGSRYKTAPREIEVDAHLGDSQDHLGIAKRHLVGTTTVTDSFRLTRRNGTLSPYLLLVGFKPCRWMGLEFIVLSLMLEVSFRRGPLDLL